MAKTNKEKISEAMQSGAWIDVAWANLSSTKFAMELFGAVRKKDRPAKEQLATIENIEEDEPSSWVDMNDLTPMQRVYVAALIHDEEGLGQLRPALLRGFDLGRPLATHVGQPARDRIIPLLCASAHEQDREAASAYLATAPTRYVSYDTSSLRPLDRMQMAAGFASQDDSRGDETLMDELARFAAGPRRNASDGFEILLDALVQRAHGPMASQWASLLARCLPRGVDVALTLCTLAPAMDADARKYVSAMRQRHAFGDDRRDRAKRVSADAVLAHAGEAASGADARWLRAHLEVQSYAWPNQAQHGELMALCARLLSKIGTAEEHRWAARILKGDQTKTAPKPIELTPPPAKVEVVRGAVAPFTAKLQIKSIAVSPDGRLLCVVGNTGAFFDRQTGAQVRPLEMRNCWATDCAFTPDGKQVLLTFHAGHVKLFAVKTGKETCAWKGYGEITCLAWGTWKGMPAVITGADNGRLDYWTLDGAHVWTLELGENIYDVVRVEAGWLVAGGRYIKPGVQKGAVWLVSDHGALVKAFNRPARVWALDVSQDGRIALGGEFEDVELVRLKGERLVAEAAFPLTNATRLVWLSNSTLLGCTSEGLVAEFDCVSGKTRTLANLGEKRGLSGLARHEATTFVGGTFGEIAVIEGTQLRPLALDHSSNVLAMVELADGSILTGDWDGRILRHDSELGNTVQLAALGMRIEAMALSNGRLAVATHKGMLMLSPTDGAVLARLKGDIEALDVREHLIACVDAKRVRIMTSDLQAIEDIDVLRPEVVALLPGGEVAVGTGNGDVIFFRKAKETRRLQDHGADRLDLAVPHMDVADICVSADGAYVATGATDGTVRVYTVPDLVPVVRLQCDFGLFDRMSFSADGRWLAAAAAGSLSMIDLVGRTTVWTLKFEDGVSGAWFLKDGRLVVVSPTGDLSLVKGTWASV